MTELTLKQQEELFAKDCKLINLIYEYQGYTGKEKWAIITELTEKELRDKYPDIIERYTPFLLLSVAQGEVIFEAKRNDDKYNKRAKRTIDAYGYEDDISEQFHKGMIVPFIDPFSVEELTRIENEKIRKMDIIKVRKTLKLMQPIQRQRLLKSTIDGLSSRTIAQEESVNYSSVDKSIMAAKKNFKKIFENL